MRSHIELGVCGLVIMLLGCAPEIHQDMLSKDDLLRKMLAAADSTNQRWALRHCDGLSHGFPDRRVPLTGQG